MKGEAAYIVVHVGVVIVCATVLRWPCTSCSTYFVSATIIYLYCYGSSTPTLD